MGMKNRWIALYVENQVGVLAEVSGLFSAKCYNFHKVLPLARPSMKMSRA